MYVGVPGLQALWAIIRSRQQSIWLEAVSFGAVALMGTYGEFTAASSALLLSSWARAGASLAGAIAGERRLLVREDAICEKKMRGGFLFWGVGCLCFFGRARC